MVFLLQNILSKCIFLKRKSIGSSLVEVIVALTIISIVVVISSVVLLNVLQSNSGSDRVMALYKLHQIEKLTKEEHDFTSKEFKFGEIIVARKTEDQNGQQGLQRIILTAYNKRKTPIIKKQIWVRSHKKGDQ